MYSVTIKYTVNGEERITYSSSRFQKENEAKRVAERVWEEGIEDAEDGNIDPSDIISVTVAFSVR